MFDKLSFIDDRYKELETKISDPEIIADQEQWRKLCKEHSDISPIVAKYREYKTLVENIEEAKEMLRADGLDKDEKEFLEATISESTEGIEVISEELKILLLPKDPNDDKNVIVEIRGGAGGDEAALFAADLLRMYSMYAETKRWKVEMLSERPNLSALSIIISVAFGMSIPTSITVVETRTEISFLWNFCIISSLSLALILPCKKAILMSGNTDRSLSYALSPETAFIASDSSISGQTTKH